MPETRTVRDVMTSDVTTLQRNDALTLADDIMNLGRVRHMPVIDEAGHLAGLVSQRDLFRGALARGLGYGGHAQRQMLEMLRVKEVMTTQVMTTSAETPLREAAERMLKHKVGCLVVTVEDGEGEKITGILTEADFVKLVTRD